MVVLEEKLKKVNFKNMNKISKKFLNGNFSIFFLEIFFSQQKNNDFFFPENFFDGQSSILSLLLVSPIHQHICVLVNNPENVYTLMILSLGY